MHYLSGIYNKNEEGIANNNLRTLSVNEKNSRLEQIIYIKDNFGFLIEHPKNPSQELSVPFFDIDKKNEIIALLEGKIYNLKKILLTLTKNKYQETREATDCQIISFLYRQFGINFFEQLEGNFLLIILNQKNNSIILHKSKFSTKPLYYFLKNNSLVFSSLLDSLLKKEELKKEINFNYLYSYFFLDNLSLGEDTEYKDIKSLESGHVLIADKKSVSIKKISYTDYPDFDQKNNEEIINNFQKVLSETMIRQLSGLKCANIAFSGGLDSRIIGEYAKKIKIPINTYTVRFKATTENKIIDYNLAQKNSKKIEAKHYVLDLDIKKLISEIPFLLRDSVHLINFNNLNTLYILNWISVSSGSVVTGIGTEEQLSMYRYHFFPYFADRLLMFLPEYKKKERFEVLMTDYFDLFSTRSWGWPDSKEDNAYLQNGIFNKNIQKQINTDFKQTFNKHLNSSPAKQSFSGFFNKVLWIDFNYNLTPKLSTISSYLSKKNSAEIILPFFDQKFISNTAKIPADLKNKQGKMGGKYILRECAKKIIGEKESFITFKSGSDIPFAEWLIDPVFERFIKEKLQPKKIKEFGIINPQYIERIIKEYYEDKELIGLKDRNGKVYKFKKARNDHTRKLLKILGLQLWLENNF